MCVDTEGALSSLLCCPHSFSWVLGGYSWRRACYKCRLPFSLWLLVILSYYPILRLQKFLKVLAVFFLAFFFFYSSCLFHTVQNKNRFMSHFSSKRLVCSLEFGSTGCLATLVLGCAQDKSLWLSGFFSLLEREPFVAFSIVIGRGTPSTKSIFIIKELAIILEHNLKNRLMDSWS